MKVTVTQECPPGSFGCQRTLWEKLTVQQWQWREAVTLCWVGDLVPLDQQKTSHSTPRPTNVPLLSQDCRFQWEIPRGTNLRRPKGLPEIPPGGAGSQQAVPVPGREWLLGAEGRGKVRPTGDLGWNPLKFTNLILSWFCSRLRGSRHFLFYPNQLSNLQREDKGAAVIFPKPSTKSMTLLCPETPKMSMEVRTLNSLKEDYHLSHIQW